MLPQGFWRAVAEGGGGGRVGPRAAHPHLTHTPGLQPPLAFLDCSRWILYPSRDLPQLSLLFQKPLQLDF